jgi:outer membrane protein
MNYKNIRLLLIGICLYSAAQGQSPILESYIQTGLAGNLALQQKEMDIRKSMEAVQQAKALFFPTLSFNANYTLANGGRRIELPIGDLLNPVYSTLNQITQTTAFPQIENTSIQFLPNNFQETKVKFAYPLFNSDLRFNRQIQELLLQSQSAQKAAYEQELRFQITDAYLQYLKTLEAEKIWTNTLEVLRELKRFNESLVKNNVATKDIISTAEYELLKAEHELVTVKNDQNTIRAYFNFLINKDLQSEINADPSLLQKNYPSYQLDLLTQSALSNRQEFKALRAGISATETAVKLNEAHQKLPTAYIGGEAGFQGFGYQFFNGQQAYVLAQVGVQYDLYNGGLNKSKSQMARIEAAQLSQQFTESQQKIALEVTQNWNQFLSAQDQLRTAQAGLNAAESTFKIIQNKYKAGQVLLLEFLDAQNRVTNAQLQLALAKADAVSKEAALKKAASINE